MESLFVITKPLTGFEVRALEKRPEAPVLLLGDRLLEKHASLKERKVFGLADEVEELGVGDLVLEQLEGLSNQAAVELLEKHAIISF